MCILRVVPVRIYSPYFDRTSGYVGQRIRHEIRGLFDGRRLFAQRQGYYVLIVQNVYLNRAENRRLTYG